eukprot:scaffold155838_cov17-Tisochrysis_lutea.AAC.1
MHAAAVPPPPADYNASSSNVAPKSVGFAFNCCPFMMASKAHPTLISMRNTGAQIAALKITRSLYQKQCNATPFLLNQMASGRTTR